jgi:hypothetical protein
LVVLKKVRQA